MSNDWIEIYRDYSGEELDAEIAKLKQEATVYTAQNIGDKGYQKSLEMVQNRLHAAIRVRNERRQGGSINPSWGVPDFSGLGG
jgi:hypothetical protein